MIIKPLLAFVLLISLAALAASAAAEPGLTFYSNGRQEWMPFEQFVSLDLPSLKGKLQDISNHTDWVRSISEQEFKNVVSETIEQGTAVKDALVEKQLDDRAAVVADFVKSFEEKK